ncbi:MAG: biopolymer transporter ExbD [Verrucomicrobiaceae bacterium]|nr:biopolymer transporter ExbD [Verrucomicrobiaceae bacterium]
MAGGGGGGDGEPEFQIAPMIDVLLVLLIFFMSITTSQVLQIDKDIKLPVAPDAKKKEDKNQMNEGAVNVAYKANKATIKFGGNVGANDFSDNLQGLVDRLTELKQNNASYRVIIRGDRSVPAVEIQKVMNVIGQAGIDDISFSALNNDI